MEATGLNSVLFANHFLQVVNVLLFFTAATRLDYQQTNQMSIAKRNKVIDKSRLTHRLTAHINFVLSCLWFTCSSIRFVCIDNGAFANLVNILRQCRLCQLSTSCPFCFYGGCFCLIPNVNSLRAVKTRCFVFFIFFLHLWTIIGFYYC